MHLAGYAMDESVRAAMEKWPDVPAVYGWLSLDERGHWRLRGEPVTHPGLIAFINRNYECDDDGRWFFQNGPQRGYVRLAYTPWVLHVDSGGLLRTHAGNCVNSVSGAWLDEEGNLLLETEHGVGLVESDALPRVGDWLSESETARQSEALMEDAPPLVCLHFGAARIPLQSIMRDEVPRCFGYVADPQPPSKTD